MVPDEESPVARLVLPSATQRSVTQRHPGVGAKGRWSALTRRVNRHLYGLPNQLTGKRFSWIHLALVLALSGLFYLFLTRLSGL